MVPVNFVSHKTIGIAPAFIFFSFVLVGCNKKNECDGTTLPQTGTCTPVALSGHLTQNGDTLTYRTSGGGIVVIEPFFMKIHHDNYSEFKYEFWGGDSVNGQPEFSFRHENLNGKHIKDRLGKNRTIVFPDGAKVTVAAIDTFRQVLSITIYDGAECHRINFTCHKVEYSSTNLCISQGLDNAEADGEASSFEITSTGLLFFNSYTEDTPGNKVENRYNLGELTLGLPNNVRDWFDDPRLGHT